MKNLVLRQTNLKIALGGGERVAESDIRQPVNEGSEFHHDLSRGQLCAQNAGWKVCGNPFRHHRGIEAEFLQAVAVEHGGEAEGVEPGVKRRGGEKIVVPRARRQQEDRDRDERVAVAEDDVPGASAESWAG